MTALCWNGEIHAVYGRYELCVRPCGGGWRWAVKVYASNLTLHRENGCKELKEATDKARAWAESQMGEKP